MKRNILKVLFVICVLNITACQDPNPTISIENVKVVGSFHEDQKVEMFLGLPFAMPPINELRWRKPLSWAPKTDNKILANSFKPACFQNQRIVDWYKRLIIDFGGNPETFDSPSFSEDCLYLNLWRPHGDQENLPVIVYIHGGSNKAGWSYEPNYLGHNIANKGFILISIPYRLGVFGFFSHPEVENPNLALFDQLMALQWIQDYVSLFGGDPSNVTLVGESAGAGGISHLIASPLSKDLFHKAIHQSGGSSLSYPLANSVTEELAIEFSNAFAKPSIEYLRTVSAEDILQVSEEIYGNHYFDYVEDGESVINSLPDLYMSGNIQDVDLLIGANNDEWSLYFDANVDIERWLDEEVSSEQKVELIELLKDIKDPIRKMDLLITAKNFVCPSLLMASSVNKKGNNAWVYQFNRVREGENAKKYGAYHGAELPYVFNTHDSWLPTNNDDLELTQAIQSYWLSFAQNGDPNSKNAPLWKKYDEVNSYTQILDSKIIGDVHPSKNICDVLASY